VAARGVRTPLLCCTAVAQSRRMGTALGTRSQPRPAHLNAICGPFIVCTAGGGEEGEEVEYGNDDEEEEVLGEQLSIRVCVHGGMKQVWQGRTAWSGVCASDETITG